MTVKKRENNDFLSLIYNHGMNDHVASLILTAGRE